MEVRCPENILIEITPELLLDETMKMKNAGLRLSQACAVYKDGKYELSYSFAEEGTNQYSTLRIVMDKDVSVRSITPFYPYAFLYENEMKELFGVKIEMINVDYEDRLYRIKQEAPFVKKEGE